VGGLGVGRGDECGGLKLCGQAGAGSRFKAAQEGEGGAKWGEKNGILGAWPASQKGVMESHRGAYTELAEKKAISGHHCCKKGKKTCGNGAERNKGIVPRKSLSLKKPTTE